MRPPRRRISYCERDISLPTTAVCSSLLDGLIPLLLSFPTEPCAPLQSREVRPDAGELDDEILEEILATWLATTTEIDAVGATCRRLASAAHRSFSSIRRHAVGCSRHGTFTKHFIPAFSTRSWPCRTSYFGAAVATADSCAFACVVVAELPPGAYRASWRVRSSSDSAADFRLVVRLPAATTPLATSTYRPKRHTGLGWRDIRVGDILLDHTASDAAGGKVRVEATFAKDYGVRTTIWNQAAIALDCVHFRPLVRKGRVLA